MSIAPVHRRRDLSATVSRPPTFAVVSYAAMASTPPTASPTTAGTGRRPSLIGLLAPYTPIIAALVVLTILANGLNLTVPRLIARGIDGYSAQQPIAAVLALQLLAVSIGIFLFTYCQNVVQTNAAERVARDLRTKLIAKLSIQDHAYIQRVTPAVLLTNLTSDVDAVKNFVSQAIASLVSSVFLIIGASILLLSINWKLGLLVLAILPVIGVTFSIVFARVRKLFLKSQGAIDTLNNVINESILGAALIRLLNSQHYEYEKFLVANANARDISLGILRLFAGLIPVIMFSTNLATLMILVGGGRFVIQGSMTLGDFSAFNNYLFILIFPVIVIGFMSNVMALAGAAFQRISLVLEAPVPDERGTSTARLQGDIGVQDAVVTLAGKPVLKHISFFAKAGTKNAIIGPTAAGKTQLLYLLTGLLTPDSGRVEYDGVDIAEYDKASLHQQIGFVSQDSIIFSLTLRENIAFSKTVTDEDLERAITTAELKDFVETLPDKLDTGVSERGTSLSGGQKQRIMLARALALNPRILLLDDFTSRVDSTTERKILDNVRRNYPDLTLVSVTQKIAPVEDYDQIVLLMEGEVLAAGGHRQLLETSPEYVQIYESQRSTSHYELFA
jgi:ATP-binding cassette subfamily B protein